MREGEGAVFVYIICVYVHDLIYMIGSIVCVYAYIELAPGHRFRRPRGTGSVGDSVGEGTHTHTHTHTFYYTTAIPLQSCQCYSHKKRLLNNTHTYFTTHFTTLLLFMPALQ